MELNTCDLRLRELELTDVDALNAIEADPRVVRYMAFDMQSHSETSEYIRKAILAARQHPRETIDLAIVRKTDQRLIGRCGLGLARREHKEGLIWYLLHPDAWGREYAVQAAAALLQWAFDDLGLHRVWADCDVRNTASCRVAGKLGMRIEGVLRENYFLKGEWCDTVVYAVLDREWRAERRRIE